MAKDHVMIDIEALALKYGGVVASIGAVRFDPYAGVQTAEELMKDSVQINIDIEDAIKLGMEIDGDTLKWWFRQSREAQELTFLQPSVLQVVACQQLNAFLTVNSSDKRVTMDKIWANGANYDPILLEGIYDKVGQRIPWKYYNVRCHRTVKKISNYDLSLVPANLVKHSAVHDAIHQAQELQAIAFCNEGIML